MRGVISSQIPSHIAYGVVSNRERNTSYKWKVFRSMKELYTPQEFDYLEKLVKSALKDTLFSDLSQVMFDQRGFDIAGRVLFSKCREKNIEFEPSFTHENSHSISSHSVVCGVGALTISAISVVCSLMSSAVRAQYKLQGFSMDWVFPGVKGPSLEDKNILLADAWLSDRSYIQTSSIVTLTRHNELDIDFAILDKKNENISAIIALVGGGSQPAPSEITLINSLTGEEKTVPFIYVFDAYQLMHTGK